MNLHPLVVHFPIALLSIYCILEFIRIKSLRNNQTWFYIKLVFLLLGTASALVAAQLGEIAAHLVFGETNSSLASLHALWAKLTIAGFLGLSGCYGIAWAKTKPYIVNPFVKQNATAQKLWDLLVTIQRVITETPLALVAALAGFISLSITGALGGAIVYGPDADIFTQMVTRLFLGD